MLRFVALIVLIAVAASQKVDQVIREEYNDTIACGRSSFVQSTVLPNNQCLVVPDNSSASFDCTNVMKVRVFQSTTYEDANCKIPTATHYNYCGECKYMSRMMSLRECVDRNGTMVVLFKNCSDLACTTCSPLAEMPVLNPGQMGGVCSPNPYQGRFWSGNYGQVNWLGEGLAMPHKWYDSNDCTLTNTTIDGGDLIVLNSCNSGWFFRCQQV